MKHIVEEGMTFKTNSCGDLVIVRKLEKGYFLVRFVETGYEVTANRANIIAGKVRDHTCTDFRFVVKAGLNIVRTSNAGDEFVILEQRSNKYLIKFTETQHMMWVYKSNADTGKVKDPYKKSFLGIGFLGEPVSVPYHKKAYQLWSNMLKRCYNPKDSHGYFGRCFVDPRWHSFANFLTDLPKLENFKGWLDASETGVKYHLDKDLLIEGNDIYSVESCAFVLEQVNKGATSRNNYYR